MSEKTRQPSAAQQAILDAGLLTSGFNCILQMPTGAGKTWLAEHAIGDCLDRGQRAIYLAPLRALAAELGARWATRFAPHKVGVYTGEMPVAGNPPLEEARLLVITPERLDACTRSWRSQWGWLPDVDLVVADELHLLGDAHRGARLEGALVRFTRLNPFARILGLSATLGNRTELSDWLRAVDFASDVRPIPLTWKRVSFKKADQKPNLILGAVRPCVAAGGRSLVFTQSRRRAEELARFLAGEGLKAEHHHAGLDRAARAAVEGRLRAGETQVLVATATLEMGLNLPVRQVVLADTQAWDGEGFLPLAVTSVWQRAGRAGRLGLDESGEVVLVDAGWGRKVDYAAGQFEPIRSRLSDPAHLAEQVVAEVASGLCRTTGQVKSALGRSLAAHQGCLLAPERIVAQMVETGMLIEQDRVGREPLLRATHLGRIASRHLLAPDTVLALRRALEAAPLTFFDILFVAASSGDCEPVLRVDFEEVEALREAVALEPSALLQGQGEGVLPLLRCGGKRALAALKMAVVVRELTRCGDAAAVAERHDCYPFEVERLRESMSRLLVAADALVGCLKNDEEAPRPDLEPLARKTAALSRMVAAGLDESAATLTLVPGIGPKTARRLHAAGIEHIEDLALAGPSDLLGLRGVSEKRAAAWIEAAEKMVPEHSAASLVEDQAPAVVAASAAAGVSDPYRLRRALDLAVTRLPNGAFDVRGGLEPHRTTLAPDGCDCQDHAKGRLCKHILAARLAEGDPELAAAVAKLKEPAGGVDLSAWWTGGGAVRAA